MKKLELLAPAKNLECGIAAIDHGADAVYIGSPRFGARAAAGNSLEDISQLCQYAHQYGAKVHVAFNTIVYDHELEDALEMVGNLDEIGVDALIVQDLGLFKEMKERHLWARELHASTQCDSRSAEKVAWLHSVGFSRAVLARELTLDEIAQIHKAVPSCELEVFVHGALCVSYSGVCYASEKCFDRSANRGECAQFCRMKFDLLDADGVELEHQRHLLSLRDLCQIDHLKDLADAGASSFKIEGRLKDASYVKNVVAAYSQRLNEIVDRWPELYQRASVGRVEYDFEPNLKKTFNRGFTNYFLKGRQPNIASFDTPKAMGEYVGKVKEIRGKVSFNVASVASFSNGDGLCFINDEHELEGFRVNRVVGNRLFPFHLPENLRPGMALYRNNDRAFEALMSRPSAKRKIPIAISFGKSSVTNDGKVSNGIKVIVFVLDSLSKELSHSKKHQVGSFFFEYELEKARKSQRDNIIAQLSKFGDTIYDCKQVELMDGVEDDFIPNSILTSIRRQIAEGLENQEKEDATESPEFSHENILSQPLRLSEKQFVWNPEYGKWGYLYNIANEEAKTFYQLNGKENIAPAFELGHDADTAQNKAGESLIMQCRHCIRYSLGYCVKNGGMRPTWKEPLFLRLGDGKMFRLEFACKECQMNVYSVK